MPSGRPLSGKLGVPRPVRPFKVKEKIRMLVVAGPAPRPYDSLDITGEITRIIDSVQELKNSGRVEIVVARPILSEVEHLLSNEPIPYPALHRPRGPRRGRATSPRSSSWPTASLTWCQAQSLGTILGRYTSLQLVLLNACEGARTDYRDPFKGVASALVKAGISVVVAMQGAIRDGAASNFAGAFYEKLIAMAMPYDDALLSARRNLFAADRKYLEWATPVLFSRTKNRPDI